MLFEVHQTKQNVCQAIKVFKGLRNFPLPLFFAECVAKIFPRGDLEPYLEAVGQLDWLLYWVPNEVKCFSLVAELHRQTFCKCDQGTTTG